MDVEPCSVCGAQVRIEKREGNRRLGDVEPPVVDVRVCTDPACRTNNRTRRLGDAV